MDHVAFIRQETRVLPVPHAPALHLHLADDATALWQRTEEQLAEIGLPPPYWAFAWAGGQALARHVLDHPDTVAGRAVLDLGSGSGLVAIAAMRAGAARAVANDIDAFAQAAITLNAALNGVAVAVVGDDLLDGDGGDAETVLVGDLCYERPLAQRVTDFLLRARAAGKAILLGDPGRTYLPKDRLVQLAEYSVPTTRALEDAEIKRTSVWTLR